MVYSLYFDAILACDASIYVYMYGTHIRSSADHVVLYCSDCSLIEKITAHPMAYPPPPKLYSVLQDNLPSPQQYLPNYQSTTVNVTVVQPVHARAAVVRGGGVTCPSCQNTVVPTTVKKIRRIAWLWVLILILCGLFLHILLL